MLQSDRDHIFDLILRMSECLKQECNILCELIDLDEDFETVSKRISISEDDADNLMHEIHYYYLDQSLADGKDSTALLEVAESVERCTDTVDDIAKDFVRYNVSKVRDNAVASIISANAAAQKLIEVIFAVRNMTKTDTPFKVIFELDHFKIESDKLFDLQMQKLFENEKDPIEIIKWKDLYNSFRKLFDDFEEVAEICSRYSLYQEK